MTSKKTAKSKRAVLNFKISYLTIKKKQIHHRMGFFIHFSRSTVTIQTMFHEFD